MRTNNFEGFRRYDGLLAIVLFGVGAWIGASHLLSTGFASFYQHWMPATVMWACGHGLVDPVEPMPDELKAFLLGGARIFDCAILNSVRETAPASSFLFSYPYLGFAAALSWRALGVSYASLAPFVAALYGLYCTGCFVFIRLFFPAWLASPAALVLAVSPIALPMLTFTRDFSKAPFFLWGAVLLILAIRQRQSVRYLLCAGAVGALIGIGSGFRTDVILLLPLAVPILAATADLKMSLRARLGAIGLLVAGFAVFASPMFVKGGAGAGGYWLLQGLAEPFRKHAGIREVPYDVGFAYLDAVNLTGVVADLRPKDPQRWEAEQAASGSDLSSSKVMVEVTPYVLGWLPLFAADVATRQLQSLWLTSGFYAIFSPAHASLDPNQQVPYGFPILRSLGPALQIAGALGLLAFIFSLYVRAPRESLAVAFLLAGLLAAPGFQFSIRHLFHLEPIYWLGILSLIRLPWVVRRAKGHVFSFLLWLGTFAAVGGAIYGTLLFVQDRRLKAEVAKLLALPRQDLPTETLQLPGDRQLVGVGVPAEYQDLVAAPVVPFVFLLKTAADRIVVSVRASDSCRASPLRMRLVYANGGEYYERTLSIPVPSHLGNETLVLTSAFYTPYGYFRGIAVPAAMRGCVAGIARLPLTGPLPSMFTATLVPGWERGRMFELPALGW